MLRSLARRSLVALIVTLANWSQGLVLTNHFNDYPPDLQCGQLWTNQGVVLHFSPTVVPDDGPVAYCNFSPIPGSAELWPCRLVLDFSNLKKRVTRIELNAYVKIGTLWFSASANGFGVGIVTNSASETQSLALSFDVVQPDAAVIYATQAYLNEVRIFLDDYPAPPQAPWKLRLQTTNLVYWTGAALSADGTRAFALGNDSPNAASAFYTSTNTGLDWTNRPVPFAIWQGLAASGDGERLVAAASTGQIFTSTNSGTDWTQCKDVPSLYWSSVAVSSNGSHIIVGSVAAEPYVYDPGQRWPPLPVVIRPNGALFTSADFGATWQSNNLPVHPAWSAVATSAEGKCLVAAGGNHGLYYSADAGQSWAALSAPLSYVGSVVSSADGHRLFASGLDAAGNNSWVVSTNAGTNWLSKAAPPGGYSWPYLASSTDGLHIVAVDGYHQPIFTSADAGQRWTQHDSPLVDWRAVASSADGSQLLALGLYSLIYTWQYQPALKATVDAQGQLVISWASTTLANGFELEHTASLSYPSWTPVNGLFQDDGTNRYLPFGASTGPHFFRLRK